MKIIHESIKNKLEFGIPYSKTARKFGLKSETLLKKLRRKGV